MYGIYSKLTIKAPVRLVEYPLSTKNLFKLTGRAYFNCDIVMVPLLLTNFTKSSKVSVLLV